MKHSTETSYPPPYTTEKGVKINAIYNPIYAEILTAEALAFIAKLHRTFNKRRLELLEMRKERQQRLDAGEMPCFLKETIQIRESDWVVAPIPDDLQDRRVEITGPVDRKMIINALNSGAKVFMADFEDSNAPSWSNNIEGQLNLKDAIRKTIHFKDSKTGKEYKLNEKIATLMVRPRGWHLSEKTILIDDEPISGSLLDFGLYFFHNAKELIKNGSAPYFYLPKLENHIEARLWNDVFASAQIWLNIPVGTIRATVLIETILAAFEMNEILWELREHSAGLNCGRWDYIFSIIKKFANNPSFIMPNRDQVTMTVPCMKAYCDLVIKTCHQRGIHAMGGMAAQIPIRNDENAHKLAIEKVFLDKKREVEIGHDGTWVAHPALVPIAMDVFNDYMPTPNQINTKKREEVNTTADDLLAVPLGSITEIGVRENINIGILYIESWLRGNGAAAIYHKMEDAATAEISRAQIWQWIKNEAITAEGQKISLEWVRFLIPSEIEKIKDYVGLPNYEKGRFREAIEIFDYLISTDQFQEFLTLEAYNYL